MNIVLAPGIFPPALGGPATYARKLGEQLSQNGHTISVVTYACPGDTEADAQVPFPVHRVSFAGGPLARWKRFEQVLEQYSKDADVIYTFDTVSTGIPVTKANTSAKKVLRLGGDFLWERYTDWGGKKSLREYYQGKPLFKKWQEKVLNKFDHIVFSTAFQKGIYDDAYSRLPVHQVLENACTIEAHPHEHHAHQPFRLLSFGRLVAFKQLQNLIMAMQELPDCVLNIVGDGPMKLKWQQLTQKLGVDSRIIFTEPVHGEQKQDLFEDHDLLVVPSLTDISPNATLEASAAGLPVLVTEETGLSKSLTRGMVAATLRTPEQIVMQVNDIKNRYHEVAMAGLAVPERREWSQVAAEHEKLFESL